MYQSNPQLILAKSSFERVKNHQRSNPIVSLDARRQPTIFSTYFFEHNVYFQRISSHSPFFAH